VSKNILLDSLLSPVCYRSDRSDRQRASVPPPCLLRAVLLRPPPCLVSVPGLGAV